MKSNGQANTAFGESPAPTVAICGNKPLTGQPLHSQGSLPEHTRLPVPEHFWSGTVLLRCSLWQRTQENGGTVPRQAMLTFQRSPFCVAKPLPTPLTCWVQPPALVCFCTLDRDGLKCTWGLEEKIGLLLEIPNHHLPANENPQTTMIPFLHSHLNWVMNFWQTVFREQHWCARYYES